MNWYYAEAGQQVGPVAEEELLRLVETGRIRSDTLVWHEGLANWQPYGELKPGPGPLPESAAPPVAGPAPAGNEVACVECGKIVSQEEAISYGGNWVCAACKPRYFQRIREGAAMPGLSTDLRYAGFWIRFGAKFIDGIVLGLAIGLPIFIIIFFFAFRGGFSSRNPSGFSPMAFQLQILLQLGSVIISVGYNWFFLAKYGATPGKMACGLKVVTPTGAPISSGQALGRSAAEILSRLICLIGYIMAAFDSEKRTLHDHMASTRVVYK